MPGQKQSRKTGTARGVGNTSSGQQRGGQGSRKTGKQGGQGGRQGGQDNQSRKQIGGKLTDRNGSIH